jgi:HlyD family secretion protein
MKAAQPIWIKVMLVAAAAAAAGGYYFWNKSQAKPLDARYKTETVAYGDVTQTVSANGTLNPVVLVNVGTQVSGTVQKLYADYNSHVAAGQVLAELDPALLVAQKRQDEATRANARASYDLAVANEARMRALFAQEYVSKQDMDQAVQARKSAKAQVEQAEAAVEKDRTNLAYTVIRSPVSGVVVDRQVDVGQTVAASFQTPTLFKIAQDLRQMQIDSSFAEADIGTIRVGQSAHFTVDAYPNRPFYGTVRQIRLNPTTQQNVVTYDVVIAVENPDQILLPGMTAYVTIAVAEHRNVLLVPNAALRFKPDDALKGMERTTRADRPKPGTSVLYVLAEDRLQPFVVTVGITDSRVTEMSAGGLKAGDRVVVEDEQAAAPSSLPPTGIRLRMF